MSFFYFLRECKDKHGECIFLAVSVSTRKDRTTRKPLRGAHLEVMGVGVANQLPFIFQKIIIWGLTKSKRYAIIKLQKRKEMIEMKVFVEVGMYVDVEEPVFEDLLRIHTSDENARGTDAQYDEAVAAIERKIGVLFYDPKRDESEHSSPRILYVADAEKFEPILEA